MATFVIIAVCCLAAGIGIPALGSVLRDRDFKKQVSGKRPERKYNKNPEIVSGQEKSPAKVEMERERDIAWLKSKQNLFGPK